MGAGATEFLNFDFEKYYKTVDLGHVAFVLLKKIQTYFLLLHVLPTVSFFISFSIFLFYVNLLLSVALRMHVLYTDLSATEK